jgi:filamentous hemagglutinin
MPTRPLKIDKAQFGAKVGRHIFDFGKNPKILADRDWLMRHILDIYMNPTEIRDGTFSGQGTITSLGNVRGPVWFYAKGRDVVVTDKSDNFVTILKDGVLNNTSFRLAKVLSGRP